MKSGEESDWDTVDSEILEKLNEWSLVELSNGSKGWILSSTFQTIK